MVSESHQPNRHELANTSCDAWIAMHSANTTLVDKVVADDNDGDGGCDVHDGDHDGNFLPHLHLLCWLARSRSHSQLAEATYAQQADKS